MTFLAGPPDKGPGSVLRRKTPPVPLTPPPMGDITYTSFALGMQPSPQEPMQRELEADSNEPLKVRLWSYLAAHTLSCQ